ncbi:MAG: hypothetical protein PVG97_09705, partial [Syntrophobacterales bacterium]
KVLEKEPVKVFTVPENVVFARIDPETGELANPSDEKAIFEAFKEGTAPAKTTQVTRPTIDEFFKGDLDAEPM